MTSFNPTQLEDLLWRVVTSVAHQASWAALAWASVTSGNTFFPSNIGNLCSWRTSRGIHFKAQLGMEVFISGSQVCEKKSISGLGWKRSGLAEGKVVPSQGLGSLPSIVSIHICGCILCLGQTISEEPDTAAPGTSLGYNPIPHLHQWEPSPAPRKAGAELR